MYSVNSSPPPQPTHPHKPGQRDTHSHMHTNAPQDCDTLRQHWKVHSAQSTQHPDVESGATACCARIKGTGSICIATLDTSKRNPHLTPTRPHARATPYSMYNGTPASPNLTPTAPHHAKHTSATRTTLFKCHAHTLHLHQRLYVVHTAAPNSEPSRCQPRVGTSSPALPSAQCTPPRSTSVPTRPSRRPRQLPRPRSVPAPQTADTNRQMLSSTLRQ